MARISINQDDLNFCDISSSSLRSNCFPDFLIVGPQRTGTTWLAYNLAAHPEVLFSDPKEVFYFNLLNNPKHPQFQTQSLEWYLRYFEKSPQERLRRFISYLRYYKRPYRIKSYGEGTASYAADSGPEIIDEILFLNPKIKIIIMLRNPIRRAWAHAKKDLSNVSMLNDEYRKIEEIPEKELVEFLTHDYQLKCGRFSKIHELWKSKLPPEQLFVGLFDDLRDNPTQLLLDSMKFIGVQSDPKFLTHRMGKVVSPTDKSNDRRALPEKYEKLLQDIFVDEIKWVNQFAGRELVN